MYDPLYSAKNKTPRAVEYYRYIFDQIEEQELSAQGY